MALIDLNNDGIEDYKQSWFWEKAAGFAWTFLLWHSTRYPNTELAKAVKKISSATKE